MQSTLKAEKEKWNKKIRLRDFRVEMEKGKIIFLSEGKINMEKKK